MSDSVRPHRWKPTRLPCPWDSPGKNTRVGCHFLFQCRKMKSESEVTQSCPTLCNPMDRSPPGSSVHVISQARVLEWGAIAFSEVNNAAAAAAAKSLQSCPTLCNPIDGSPSGSPVPGILQARGTLMSWSGLPFPSPMCESEVAQSCPTLSDPMDYSLPGSSIHGIFQAGVLEWAA